MPCGRGALERRSYFSCSELRQRLIALWQEAPISGDQASHTDGTDDSWDPAGNLIRDNFFVYTYDAWNRMVKAQSRQDTDITIQTAEHDGLGRRITKVVTSSGDLDGTWNYYFIWWPL